MKVYLLITLFLMATYTGFAQSPKENIYVPPSANASSLIRHANIQVGHYTGIPNISIPLHTLAGKDIAIPISMDYHAGGIKVQDLSGPGGLGWSLGAVGAITRVVRGLPDGSIDFCSTFRGQIRAGQWEDCDAERDIFYFSFLGRTGKMFIGSDGKMYTIPYSDLSITPAIGANGIGYWIVTDESGTSYYFGQTANEREDTKYFVGDYSGTMTEKLTFTSAWYLNKVVSAKGETVATFSYTASGNESYFLYGESQIDDETINRRDVKVTTLSPKYIDLISTSLGFVSFQFVDSNRNGNELIEGGKKLDKILIKDHQNQLVKMYQFFISNFNCASHLPASNGSARLRLDAITEGINLSNTIYSFDYNININGSHGPFRNNIWLDKFGYYNWQSAPTRYNILNGSREVEASSSKAFLLTDVTYQGGAKTTLEYMDAFTGRNISVKSISQYSNGTLVAKSTYTYSGLGQLSSIPVYSYQYGDAPNTKTYKSSNSYRDMFDIDGVGSGYTTVTEAFLDGSKVLRSFTNFTTQDYQDDPPAVGEYVVYGPYPGDYRYKKDWWVNNMPFAPTTSLAPMRGLLTEEAVYSSQNAADPVAKTTYKYGQGSNVHSVEGVSSVRIHDGGSDETFAVGKYLTRSFPVYLIESNMYTYDQENTTAYNHTQNLYDYHDVHKTFPDAITTRQMNLNNGWYDDQAKVTFKYPIDIAGIGATPPTLAQVRADGVWSLLQTNVITPLEKLVLYKEGTEGFKIIGGELLTFRRNFTSSKALPYEVLTLDLASAQSALNVQTSLTSSGTVLSFDPAFHQVQSFTFDDATSNLLEESNTSGVTTSFEWGYNNSLPTASHNTIGGVQHRSTTAYNTVFGVTSKTDINNQTTSFVYDSQGRLKLLKDQDQNIIQRIRYNIGGLDEFSVGIGTSGLPSVGVNIGFYSSSNGEDIGQTKYVWDFGDGTVQETTAQTITHSYSSGGTKTIKLSKINPEFATEIATTSLIIYSLPQVSLSSTHTSFDLCSSPSLTPTLTATTSGGCPPVSLLWEWSADGTNWNSLGSSSSVSYRPGTKGLYTFRCTVSDGCGNSTQNTITINFTESTPNCQQQ